MAQMKKSGPAKPAYKAGANTTTRRKSGGSALKEITKRFGITAREARDIATAVGTLAVGTKRNIKGDLYSESKTPVKNIVKQVKEVGTAAVKGKKGTTSDQMTPGIVKPGGQRR